MVKGFLWLVACISVAFTSPSLGYSPISSSFSTGHSEKQNGAFSQALGRPGNSEQSCTGEEEPMLLYTYHTGKK